MENVIPSVINMLMRLSEVKCLEFTLTDYAKEKKEDIPAERYEFDFKVESSINKERKSLTIIMTATLQEKKDGVKFDLAILKSLTEIVIINFDDVIISKDASLGVPDQLLIIGNTISLSNTRGMYAVKLESTRFTDAIIPILDPKIFLPKRIEDFA